MGHTTRKKNAPLMAMPSSEIDYLRMTYEWIAVEIRVEFHVSREVFKEFYKYL